MNDALFELEKLIGKLNDESEKPALRQALVVVRNRVSDAFIKTEDYEEMIGQLNAKNSELWKELNALRREVEQGFEYYPGPSSHCAMCEGDLTEAIHANEPEKTIKLRIAHGLCDECKPQYDQLHPESRINPQAGVEEEKPTLRSV